MRASPAGTESHSGSVSENMPVMERNSHCFLPGGRVQVDETEDLHLRLSVTEILKCGFNYWMLLLICLGALDSREQCELPAAAMPGEVDFSAPLKIMVGNSSEDGIDARKGLDRMVI